MLCIRCTQNLECEGADLQVFGKFNIAETLRQQGINPCTIAEGKNADAQFPFSDWTPAQERLVNSLVDHIYAGFIRKVKVFLLLLSSLFLHAFPCQEAMCVCRQAAYKSCHKSHPLMDSPDLC